MISEQVLGFCSIKFKKIRRRHGRLCIAYAEIVGNFWNIVFPHYEHSTQGKCLAHGFIALQTQRKTEGDIPHICPLLLKTPAIGTPANQNPRAIFPRFFHRCELRPLFICGIFHASKPFERWAEGTKPGNAIFGQKFTRFQNGRKPTHNARQTVLNVVIHHQFFADPLG